MKDHLTLGTTPCDEPCAQVGKDDYYEQMRREALVYKKQLLRMFGDPPRNIRLMIKSFPHDFGTYHELCVIYDDEIEEEVDYAYKLEDELPEHWDEEAKIELKGP